MTEKNSHRTMIKNAILKCTPPFTAHDVYNQITGRNKPSVVQIGHQLPKIQGVKRVGNARSGTKQQMQYAFTGGQ